MADHKYVRKYMGKSGKMIYVYKDTSGHETTLNPEEEGADESGPLTSKQARATISDAERRKAKFAAFYQKAVATGKEIVEASQEESKKKSSGSGSSKKASSSKQQSGASASSSGDPTVEAFAQKIMSRSLLYEDIPPQYQTKVKDFVESMKTTGMSPQSEPVTASSEQKQDVSASSSGSTKSARNSSGSSSSANNKASTNSSNATVTQTSSSSSANNKAATNSSNAAATQASSSSTANNKTATNSSNVTTTQKASTSSSTETKKSSSGGVSGGGAGRSGHADTTVKMSDVKADSSIIAKAVDWVKKLFGK